MKVKFYTAVVLLSCIQSANATLGAFSVGQSAKSTAMGGASVALPQDALAAGSNPASMSEVGNRVDIEAKLVYAESDVDVGSRSNRQSGDIFALIPGFGANYQLTPNVTIGLSTFASGVAFEFDKPVLPVPGLKVAEGHLAQLDLLPTITYKFESGLSLGLSFVYAIQKFDAQGIPAPLPGGQFPDHGTQNAYGTSWRTGAFWQVNDGLSLGLSYSPKMKMSELSGYKDDLLSRSGGSIDSPESYSAGLAYKIDPRWTVALDYQHIAWDKVDAYSDNFGWRSQDAFKVGASYELNDDWKIAGGFNYSRRHLSSDDVLNNFLLVGINSKAVTFGATRKVGSNGELTAVAEYDFGGALDGKGASAGSRIDTDFYVITVGYGWRY